MARFDKKWLFIHVPAGVVVALLLGVGVAQCDGKSEEAAEKANVQNQLVEAGEKMDEAANRIDSLLKVNRKLGADNVRKGDTIRVLKDSVNVLNGQVRELKADNDSLVVALDDCAKSKKQSVVKKRKPKSKVAKKTVKKPVVSKKESKGAAAVPEKPVVNNTYVPAEPVVSPVVEVADVKPSGNQNMGVVIVEEAPRGTVITISNGSVNNGNIVVGNNNNVVQTVVQPDTIVRFTTVKITVVKCRVVAKQRQYR